MSKSLDSHEIRNRPKGSASKPNLSEDMGRRQIGQAVTRNILSSALQLPGSASTDGDSKDLECSTAAR